jgi:hypothetical protein
LSAAARGRSVRTRALRKEIDMRPILTCLAAALVAGAAFADTPQKVLLDPAVALDGKHEGADVLWGGRVFARSEDSGDHCLEISALPLRASDGRPVLNDPTAQGQHFVACGPDGFASAAHPVRSYLTITGTVRNVDHRFLPHHCGYLIDAQGHWDKGSAREPTNNGCDFAMPVVDVVESRAWPETPTRPGMPTAH